MDCTERIASSGQCAPESKVSVMLIPFRDMACFPDFFKLLTGAGQAGPSHVCYSNHGLRKGPFQACRSRRMSRQHWVVQVCMRDFSLEALYRALRCSTSLTHTWHHDI